MEQDLSNFRPSRIWKRMTAEQRLTAAQLFWDDEQSADQQIEAVAAIATQMKFRAKSVFALPVERRARYLATLPNLQDSIAARALVAYHLSAQRAMMGAFLDALGIAHEEGLIEEETVPKPDPKKLEPAAATLAQHYPAQDVGLYLSTLVSQDPDTWGALADLPQTGAALAR